MADGERTIKVGALSRVEGEGALHVRVRDGDVESVRLEIYEPPRFFEGLLVGRDLLEPVDITARICGICPVAYQLTAAQAIEAACGVEVEVPIRQLRRLLYCGEWIQSHALHVYLLHAPDFLGYDGAIEMSRDHPHLVARGLQLKKAGNAVIEAIGGRSIHPVNVRVGGFHRIIRRFELEPLVDPLERALESARATVRWVSGFRYPDLDLGWELVALRQGSEYPLEAGRIASSTGLDIPPSEYPDHFAEEQVEHSTALWSAHRGGRYLVGPLARFNLNLDRLPPAARAAAAEAGIAGGCRNPFRSIVIRSVELVAACEEALRLVRGYTEPDAASAEVEPKEATGHAATEAPRGLLYHRYALDAGGRIREAVIVPPTAQNQAAIEAELRELVRAHLDLPQPQLQLLCEQAIRNHDPCISCATHFLRLEVEGR